ncbi:MAG: ferrous iron transport protein B [Myxococcales bacterium]|jgi:ferrous iron transport protein B|nr:ferrous iron transport protein B [Myxococcales bacterium]
MSADAEALEIAPEEARPSAVEPAAPHAEGLRRIRIALAGNPNCGKTSLFNALTGAHQHVGNYPGVTVERRDGSVSLEGERSAALIDLPGTYSLTSLSPEEKIAQDELLTGGHDVVVVVADSTNLHRNLVLLAQVMQMGANVVLCLNMADEARAAGQVIDLVQMERLLGCPVVETIGHRRKGMKELKAAIERALASPTNLGNRLVLGERLDAALALVRDLVPADFVKPEAKAWAAAKLLMNDADYVARLQMLGTGTSTLDRITAIRTRLEAESGHDAALLITEGYFGFVDGLLREVITQSSRADARLLTKKIDAVVAHRVLGLPIFAAAMYAIFWLTFTLGDPPMGWIESGFEALTGWVRGLWPEGSESMLLSLLTEGIIGGVGGVIVFLPNILLLFLGLAFMEDTGYLARSAFLVDRLMHRFGLHGKSFIPMMTGFGCTIPGIMATRTLENERDRLVTMFVLPLISCGARLPIWMLLVPAFFPATWRAPMLFAIYASGLALALLVAFLLRKAAFKGEDAPFVMELPPYRLPTLRGVLTKMCERAWLYLKKAGTIILSVSILLWALTAFPKVEDYAIDARVAAGEVTVVANPKEADVAEADDVNDAKAKAVAAAEPAEPKAGTITEAELEALRGQEDLEASFAGRIGQTLEPLFRPLGYDWKIVTAMLGAFAAKEVFVAQMGIIYSMGEVDEASEDLRAALHRDYTPLVGISLILFLLIGTPCMATIAVTKRESGRWSWALGQFFGLTALAYAMALIVFQVGRLLGF